MKRREFMLLLSATMASAGGLRAQQGAMPMIGWLSALSPAIQGGSRMPEPGTYGSLPAEAWSLLAAFAKGLSETGYVEGQNLAIEYRWAEGHPDRLPGLAADLVAQKVNVIVAVAGTAPALAAKQATSTIPIVFTRSETRSNQAWLPASRGQEATSRVSPLHPPFLTPNGWNSCPSWFRRRMHPSEQTPVSGERYTREMQDTARAKGVQLPVFEARSENEIDTAFASLVRLHAGALVVAGDAFFTQHGQQLVALAARYAVPASYHLRGFVTAGGLISYGSPFRDLYRGAGAYVGRILAGAKPADLPVQQACTYELVVNLKTAQALGLTIPPSILAAPTR